MSAENTPILTKYKHCHETEVTRSLASTHNGSKVEGTRERRCLRLTRDSKSPGDHFYSTTSYTGAREKVQEQTVSKSRGKTRSRECNISPFACVPFLCFPFW